MKVAVGVGKVGHFFTVGNYFPKTDDCQQSKILQEFIHHQYHGQHQNNHYRCLFGEINFVEIDEMLGGWW